MGYGARADIIGVHSLLQLSVLSIQEIEIGADEDFPSEDEDPYHKQRHSGGVYGILDVVVVILCNFYRIPRPTCWFQSIGSVFGAHERGYSADCVDHHNGLLRSTAADGRESG